MKILDCTLRDGGYYTNWNFDDNLVDLYLESIAGLPIDVVELGYRSPLLKGYYGKYFHCPRFVLEHARERLLGKKLAIMIDEKNCTEKELRSLIELHVDLIDIVRFAVDPTRIGNMPKMIHILHDLGIEVAVNLMYLSNYTRDVGALLTAAETVKDADVLNLVDSYGGVYPDELTQLVKAVKAASSIILGYHGHNNLELAFANALAAANAGCDWLDATVTGMGRGAGNLKTELILTHISTRNPGSVDMDLLSSLVDGFSGLHDEHQWGTNLPYMVSGASSLPQKNVMDWVTKRSYSVNSMVRALENQRTGQTDNIKLPSFTRPETGSGPVLIIGGGPGAMAHAHGLCQWIEKNQVCALIHASGRNAPAFTKVASPQYFCLVGNEGKRIERVFEGTRMPSAGFILPPYPRKMGTYLSGEMAERSCELAKVDFTDQYEDSHTAIALQTALDHGATEIWLAGYDGYSGSMTLKERDLFMENDYLFRRIAGMGITLRTLTPSNYNILQPESPYACI
jgi:4-hydroxy 2-oxovalerate aldolase